MMAQENNRLKRVIGQMRNEMESMKDLADAKDDVAFGIAENQSRAYGTGARQLATKRLQQRGFDLSSFGTDEAVEQEENSALRAKLNDASNDLKRLMGERQADNPAGRQAGNSFAAIAVSQRRSPGRR